MTRGRLFLLDAYALIYRAYYPHSKRPRLDSKERDTSAIFGFANTLNELLTSVDPEYIAVVFDPPGGTFRHEEYPDYKAHREETPAAIRFGVPYIKQLIEGHRIPVIEIPRYEADDVIGTLALQAAQAGLDVFMVTPDKDYAQLVAPHIYMYRPLNGGGYEEWGEREVCERFGLGTPRQMIDYLGMVGDSADNLPGIPGVGPKTAQQLLEQYGSLESILEHASEQKGKLGEKLSQGREKAMLTRHLATICTDVPVELDLESYARKALDLEALTELYTEFEFSTLLSRLKARGASIAKLEDKDRATTTPESSIGDSALPQVEATPEVEGLGGLFAVRYDTPAQAATGDEDMQPEERAVHFGWTLLDTPEAIERFVSEASTSERLCLDTETTSLDALRAELVGMSFAISSEHAYFLPIPQGREAALNALAPIRPLLEGGSLKIGQNIKYDLQVLANYGITLAGALFDTMVAHYLLMPDMSHGLDALASRYLGYTMLSYEEMVAPQKAKNANLRAVPLERLGYYAAEDALITYRLYEYLEPKLVERGQRELMNSLEMPLVSVLASMEREGVMLDTDELSRQSIELNNSLEQAELDLYTLAGRPFNINSSKQIGELLFDELKLSTRAKKTKTGGYSTSEEVLEKLRDKHPIVERILDYRGLKKLLSTYIDALPEMRYEDGKLHSSFNQTVAATGRLSSSNPNLQNIPIRTPQGQAIRAAFVPDSEDCLFLSADYSQIELRLMAHFSEDPSLIEAFRLGQDIHQATAAKINGVPIEEVTPEMRRRAKTANFGIIYGISAFGLAERLSISRTDAKALIDGYFTSYPGVDRYMKQVVKDAQARGYVSTLLGRRRYLADINSANSVVRGYAERNAINAPLQGTAADIIKIAMIRIDEEIRRRGLRSRMILQVHDELNFNVYRDELDEVQALVRSAMETAYPDLAVPLEVSLGTGKNWREAH